MSETTPRRRRITTAILVGLVFVLGCQVGIIAGKPAAWRQGYDRALRDHHGAQPTEAPASQVDGRRWRKA